MTQHESNPLKRLYDHGQSFWLDNLTRSKLRTGELRRRMEEQGLKGVTSNPAIFREALAEDDEYDDQIRELAARGRSASEIYEAIVVQDVQGACDVLRDVYEETDGRDGFVSLEVSPHLAYDAQGTLEEARRLNAAVNRPNVMIKIPATRVGIGVIEQALYEGINVNITLLFSVPRYDLVAGAYVDALDRRLRDGLPVGSVASVASFFLSRIDVLADRLLSQRIRTKGRRGEAPAPERLLGKAAIASAREAYAAYHRHFSGDAWSALADAGCRTQRVLWASTSNKNPMYDDLRYVESLVARDTVTTLPDATAAQFLRHGEIDATLEPTAASHETRAALARVGVDLEAVADRLESEGVRKFVEPFDELLSHIAERAGRTIASVEIGPVPELDLADLFANMEEQRVGERLFARDRSLWSRDSGDVEDALGWLDCPDTFFPRTSALKAFGKELSRDGIDTVLMVGMGGSTGAAKVVQRLFPAREGGPRLRIVDDTDPVRIRELSREIDWAGTLVIVASKSGTTAETRSLYQHCWAAVAERSSNPTGSHFVAITDEDTPLAREAEQRGFRRTFINPADIGGRYSALSYFGLVPMAVLGVDTEAVLRSALRCRKACGPDVPARANPALRLGGALGALAARGRDKVTLSFSHEIQALGPWLRQLLAESTGKDGTGIVPILDEPSLPPGQYAHDRVFVHSSLWNGRGPLEQDRHLGPLIEEGHPVVRIRMGTAEEIGGEFLRWEMATAVAATLLRVDAFDQPDVESTKRATRELLGDGTNGDRPSAGAKLAEVGGVALFAPDAVDVRTEDDASRRAAGGSRLLDPLQAGLADFLRQADEGDYVALLPFFRRTERAHRALQALRAQIQSHFGVATMLAYGPAYLHSVGQLHKGGPDNGLYVILTDEPRVDGRGTLRRLADLHRAQAEADFRTLADAGRPVVRLQLGRDPIRALHVLSAGAALGDPSPAGEG